jgi:hypothetical protein
VSIQERIKHLESLLPQEIPFGEIYDAVIQMDMCTAGQTRDEAMTRLGDRETFVNDRRLD